MAVSRASSAATGTADRELVFVRPGCVWRFVRHGPDGRDYRNRIVYIEVAKPDRLVYKHEPEKGSEPVSFQVTVTFVKEAGKTRLTMRMLFPSAAALDHVVKTYGVVKGAHQTLARLAAYLATESKEQSS